MHKVKHIKVSELKPNPKNPRTITEEKLEELKESLRKYPRLLELRPLVVDEKGVVLGGNMRLRAIQELGLETVPAIAAENLSAKERKRFILLDNVTYGEWDFDILGKNFSPVEIEDLGIEMPDIFSHVGEKKESNGTEDYIPEVAKQVVSRLGDVWLCGSHRVMCGDSTNPQDVTKLMNKKIASLLHADPPYGMGKQSEGVANDNLYQEKLDKFQMEWWRQFRPHLESNASAYIWGNAPDLWRLWYSGGLEKSEKFELRNEIVWDKKTIPGMASPGLTQYPTASERCLFFQFGNQFLANINAEDFPEAWEPLRSYMQREADKAEIKSQDIMRVCGCGMYGHWFTRSQFTLIPSKHYEKLRNAYPGFFQRSWKDLKKEWDKLEGMRSYFDNGHDIMRDIWEFPRVVGDERHGHATPKPVAMMERIMNSSLQPGGICVEPFGGSGSTLIGAEKSGRVCFTMELKPDYVDVIVKRWEAFTGGKAVHAETKQTFETMAKKRE